MRLCTFDAGQGPRLGVVRGGWVLDANAADPAIPPDLRDALNAGPDALTRIGGLADSCSDKSVLRRQSDVRILPPVTEPGRYLDFYSFEGHVKSARGRRGLDVVPEWYDGPTYYNGNPYAFVGHGAPIRYPTRETEPDYEMELAVIMGKPVRNLDPLEWHDAILGYTILNDASARSIQMPYAKVGMGPSAGKDFGKALGPFIVTKDEVPDVRDVELVTRVNGKEWSRGRMGEARYGWGEMLAFASRDQDLRPGDIVGSGTFNGGSGYEQGKSLARGDVVEMEMLVSGKSIMTLSNPIA